MTKPKRKLMVAVAAIILIILAVLAAWRLMPAGNPTVNNVQSAAASSVYYPDPAKLPANYTFDNSSIQHGDRGLAIITINRGNGKSVTISQQAQPDSEVIDNFIKTYIPLHNALGTKLGQAQVGASSQASSLHTIASLTIKNGPWLIITSPADISQTDLKQIIDSLRR